MAFIIGIEAYAIKELAVLGTNLNYFEANMNQYPSNATIWHVRPFEDSVKTVHPCILIRVFHEPSIHHHGSDVSSGVKLRL